MNDSKPIVLDYESPLRQKPKDKLRLVFLFLAIPSLIVPFVPFTLDISPLDAITGWIALGNFATLGFSFFLAIPLFLLKIRKRFSRNATLPEHAIAVGFAIVSYGINCWWVWQGRAFLIASWSKDPLYLSFTLLALGVLLQSFLAAWMLRTAAGRHDISETSLLAAYISMAIPSLVGFAQVRNVGWYLACFVVGIFITDIGHLVIQGMRRSRYENNQLT